ncbi:unnamed protein product [Caenorhabditis angaria]|uniref:F-box domain-containing protein n=1 Tax=Caenorhabditis angaria TaxID=860376 RepID=A0A9P1J0J1_9PELO|nr:unnamed protein product [Caenorhabditis angaria]
MSIAFGLNEARPNLSQEAAHYIDQLNNGLDISQVPIERLREICDEHETNMDVENNETFDLMAMVKKTPLDAIRTVFNCLSFKDSNSLRKSCKLMDNFYNKFRPQLDGPICDSIGLIVNANSEIIVRNYDKVVDYYNPVLASQYYGNVLTNIECKQLFIYHEANEIAVDVFRKFLKNWKIETITFVGDKINGEMIEFLDEKCTKSLNLEVEEYEKNDPMTASKIKKLYISEPITCMTQVINLNRMIEGFHISLEWPMFETFAHSLQSFTGSITNLDHWEMDLYNGPEDQQDMDSRIMTQVFSHLCRLSVAPIRYSIFKSYIGDYCTLRIMSEEKFYQIYERPAEQLVDTRSLLEILHSVPFDTMESIFCGLSFEDANRLRRTCSFMNECYNWYRNTFDGPFIDEIELKIVGPTFVIQRSKDGVNIELPEEQWVNILTNVNCKTLRISAIEDYNDVEAMSQFISSWKIEHIKYCGPTITPELMSFLDSKCQKSLSLEMVKYEETIVPATKIENIFILRPIKCFFELLASNPNIQNMHVGVSYRKLQQDIGRMEAMIQNFTKIDKWDIELYGLPEIERTDVFQSMRDFRGHLDRLSANSFKFCYMEGTYHDVMTILITRREEPIRVPEEEEIEPSEDELFGPGGLDPDWLDGDGDEDGDEGEDEEMN